MEKKAGGKGSPRHRIIDEEGRYCPADWPLAWKKGLDPKGNGRDQKGEDDFRKRRKVIPGWRVPERTTEGRERGAPSEAVQKIKGECKKIGPVDLNQKEDDTRLRRRGRGPRGRNRLKEVQEIRLAQLQGHQVGRFSRVKRGGITRKTNIAPGRRR